VRKIDTRSRKITGRTSSAGLSVVEVAFVGFPRSLAVYNQPDIPFYLSRRDVQSLYLACLDHCHRYAARSCSHIYHVTCLLPPFSPSPMATTSRRRFLFPLPSFLNPGNIVLGPTQAQQRTKLPSIDSRSRMVVRKAQDQNLFPRSQGGLVRWQQIVERS
jgi:hypothetical protein